MKIWLLHVGEDLPIDDGPRTFRYGYLADALVRRGCQVTRWAPTFHHHRKFQRRAVDDEVRVSPNFTIRLTHAPGYRHNVSLARIRSYRRLATRFTERAGDCDPTDLIVSGIPSLEWCHAAVEFGQCNRIPVVIDVRDLWPDIYLSMSPRSLRPLGRAVLHGVYRRTGRMLAKASAITAVSDSYLSWALSLADRGRSPSDIVVPIGYDAASFSSQELDSARCQLLRQGVDPAKTVCTFAGSFERSYDLTTVVGAARMALNQGNEDFQFVLCGDGSQMGTVRRQAAGLKNVIVLGWINPLLLTAALSVSRIGLAAYSKHALQSLPNKPFEYFANRLAVVSSLPGEVAELLRRHQCGLTYRAGDPRDLFKQLCQLTTVGQRLEQCRANAYQLWNSSYRCSVLYDRFADHLLTLASRDHVSPTTAAA